MAKTTAGTVAFTGVPNTFTNTNVAINFHSMGIPREPNPAPYVIAPFLCSDGYLVLQFVREHQFENLANLINKPDWIGDSRFQERTGWGEYLHSDIIPALEEWSKNRTRSETSSLLAEANVASGPVLTASEVVEDPHLEERNMIVALPRTDEISDPVLLPGNPIKMSTYKDEKTRGDIPDLDEHREKIIKEFC